MNTPPSNPIRVILVEDSELVRSVLRELCEEDGSLEVVAEASSGPEGVAAIVEHEPDLVTVDLSMPGFDGFELIQRIMGEAPVPIVVITATLHPRERYEAFHALKLGAVHVMEKPNAAHLESPKWREAFRRELRILATSTVVRHRNLGTRSAPPDLPKLPPPITAAIEVVVIAGSAGGTEASQQLLRALPVLPVPLLLALHLGPTLHEPLAQFLREASAMPVAIAPPGARLLPGTVYVAPGRRHIEFTGRARVRCFEHLDSAHHVPSFDHLFRSVAKTYGAGALGAILTGLGSDGAAGLLELRRAGGRCLAQSEASCVVAGMPRAALARGAVERSAPPSELGHTIGAWCREALHVAR